MIDAPATKAFSLPVTTMHPTASSASYCIQYRIAATLHIAQGHAHDLPHLLQRAQQLADEIIVERVQGFRSVQSDEGRLVANFRQQKLVWRGA